MSSGNNDNNMIAPRGLTASETTQLQMQLRPILVALAADDDDDDDQSDLLNYTTTMISNFKSVQYIVEELEGITMDMTNQHKEQIAGIIQNAIQNMPNEEEIAGDVVAAERQQLDSSAPSAPPKDSDKNSASAQRVISLRTGSSGNALTSSGALGAPRVRAPKEAKQHQSPKEKQPQPKKPRQDNPQQQRRHTSAAGHGDGGKGDDRGRRGGRGAGAGGSRRDGPDPGRGRGGIVRDNNIRRDDNRQPGRQGEDGRDRRGPDRGPGRDDFGGGRGGRNVNGRDMTPPMRDGRGPNSNNRMDDRNIRPARGRGMHRDEPVGRRERRPEDRFDHNRQQQSDHGLPPFSPQEDMMRGSTPANGRGGRNDFHQRAGGRGAFHDGPGRDQGRGFGRDGRGGRDNREGRGGFRRDRNDYEPDRSFGPNNDSNGYGGRHEPDNKRFRHDEIIGHDAHHQHHGAHGNGPPNDQQDAAAFSPSPSFRGGRGGGRGNVAAVLKSYTWTKGGGSAEGATESADDAAAVHPSPLVQANFQGRGRGRGSHSGGRFGHVQEILASKTWVRKKVSSDSPSAAASKAETVDEPGQE